MHEVIIIIIKKYPFILRSKYHRRNVFLFFFFFSLVLFFLQSCVYNVARIYTVPKKKRISNSTAVCNNQVFSIAENSIWTGLTFREGTQVRAVACSNRSNTRHVQGIYGASVQVEARSLERLSDQGFRNRMQVAFQSENYAELLWTRYLGTISWCSPWLNTDFQEVQKSLKATYVQSRLSGLPS